jgi:NAD(P)-dependent dehydrogenase (short-subunit alcohol dehydrogenase family)
MLLEHKTAVIYGGGGGIGGAVARAFAREGATVHLAGRTQAPLDRVAAEIRSAGGTAETAIVDALDEGAVDAHAVAVGDIDICLNVINHGDVQGTPLVEMELADYEAPIVNGVRTTFITSRAAARRMIPRKSGVILFFGGQAPPLRGYNLGGLQVGFTAIEAFRRSLANELGQHGIRVVTLKTSGVVEGIPDDVEYKQQVVDMTNERSLLGRAATFEDVGNAAVFVASDWGRTMTGTALNITCGTEVD